MPNTSAACCLCSLACCLLPAAVTLSDNSQLVIIKSRAAVFTAGKTVYSIVSQVTFDKAIPFTVEDSFGRNEVSTQCCWQLLVSSAQEHMAGEVQHPTCLQPRGLMTSTCWLAAVPSGSQHIR